jgi:hypothetical protein
MPYQVKAGRVTAIVGNEKEALAAVRRLTALGAEASILDIFGSEVDIAALKARLGGPSPEEPKTRHAGCSD